MQRASDTVIGWGGRGETETDTESGIAGPDGARQSDGADPTGRTNERGDPRMQESTSTSVSVSRRIYDLFRWNSTSVPTSVSPSVEFQSTSVPTS